MTKKTEPRILITGQVQEHCTVCGALPGLPHHDEDYKNITVVLEEYGIEQMLCQPCLQGAQEVDLEKSDTPEGLLAKAARLQTEFWDAVSELEAALDVEIDNTKDLAGVTVEDLKEANQ